MLDKQAIQKGFKKQAQFYGLTENQANQLFKKADAEGMLGQLGQGIQQMGQQGADMFKDFRAQNPAAMDAGIGGLIGGTAGSMMGGPQNRGKGALLGATAGAGIGGLGMHPGALQQLQQQFGGGGQVDPSLMHGGQQ